MKAEIEALTAELKRSAEGSASNAATLIPSPTTAPKSTATPEAKAAETSAVSASADAAQAQTAPEKPKPADPFAYADWTWLNGNLRNKDVVWDSKFFTPEFRLDAHYIMDFNHPKDDTMGGSTEIFDPVKSRLSNSALEEICIGKTSTRES